MSKGQITPKNPYGDSPNSNRRKAVMRALRRKIDGERHIKGVDECIAMAEAAYAMGDKDAVPAIRLKLDAHLGMLKKTVPDLKQVEHKTDGDKPVLVLDYTGRQAVDSELRDQLPRPVFLQQPDVEDADVDTSEGNDAEGSEVDDLLG